MEVISESTAMQQFSTAQRRAGSTIGFLATMGALHSGHLTLAQRLKDFSDVRIVSIFVNPTQFNDPKDYQAYPTPIERDLELLREEGIDAVFNPGSHIMYSPTAQTWVTVESLTVPLEGASRPGHFRGVSTVVTKLFNAVLPDVTIFGEKDFQQVRVIEQMISDLLIPIRLVRGELVRDTDGVALSSRNVRLSEAGRTLAQAIPRSLHIAAAECAKGEKRTEILTSKVLNELQAQEGVSVEYAAIVDEQTLAIVPKIDRPCRCLVAVKVDGVRLIDNIALA